MIFKINLIRAYYFINKLYKTRINRTSFFYKKNKTTEHSNLVAVYKIKWTLVNVIPFEYFRSLLKYNSFF